MNKQSLKIVFVCCVLSCSCVNLIKPNQCANRVTAAEDEFDFDSMNSLFETGAFQQPIVPKEPTRIQKFLAKVTGKLVSCKKYFSRQSKQ